MTQTSMSRRGFIAAGTTWLVGCGGPRIDVGELRKRGEPLTWRRPAIESERGLGPLDAIAAADRWAFAPDGFAPLPVPGPSDWLAQHHEDPQSVGNFVLEKPNRPGAPRTTICIAPLDTGDDEIDTMVPSLDELFDYLGRFFALPVALVEPIAISPMQLDVRERYGSRQLRTGAILDELEARLPRHAYCMLAVTREDLYPGAQWNFVFGQARLHERVGVQSLLRYDPEFDGGLPSPDVARVRGLKVVSHEVGHMFGITHCVHHACVMNGVNHTAELDRSPMHLCRVCLRKLQLVADTDLAARYERLRDGYHELGLDDEAAWVEARLDARS